jgi:hypothetical protein
MLIISMAYAVEAVDENVVESAGATLPPAPLAPPVPPRRPHGVHVTECHYCGFPVDDAPPETCPKCHGSSWDRYALPGSLLERDEGTPARGRVRRATSIEPAMVRAPGYGRTRRLRVPRVGRGSPCSPATGAAAWVDRGEEARMRLARTADADVQRLVNGLCNAHFLLAPLAAAQRQRQYHPPRNDWVKMLRATEARLRYFIQIGQSPGGTGLHATAAPFAEIPQESSGVVEATVRRNSTGIRARSRIRPHVN